MNLVQRLQHLNIFLSKLYKEETRLSSILARAGFDAETILVLRDNCLESIVNGVIATITTQLMQLSNGERLCQIVVRRYALDGFPPDTLQKLGNVYNISGERVRQLESKALRALRHRRRKEHLEDELVRLAHNLLTLDSHIGEGADHL